MWIPLLLLAAAWAGITSPVIAHNPPKESGAVVSIESRRHPRKPGGIRLVFLCSGCTDPAREGSHVEALIAAQGPQDFDVVGAPLVYAVPNQGMAGGKRLHNTEEIRGAAALFHRGGDVPLVDKVLQAQDGGAAAAVVIDDGGCDEDFISCGRHAGTAHRGFGSREHWTHWARVKIPCVLVTKKGGSKLREAMALELINFESGPQYVSVPDAAGRNHVGVNEGEEL